MGKHIKYKRINDIFTPEQLQEKFDNTIEEGWEIIYYNEKILEKNDSFERILVTMVCGKPNEGLNQKYLHG